MLHQLKNVGPDLLSRRRPLGSPAASRVFLLSFEASHHLGHQTSGGRPSASQGADCACIPTWKRCLQCHLNGQRQRAEEESRYSEQGRWKRQNTINQMFDISMQTFSRRVSFESLAAVLCSSPLPPSSRVFIEHCVAEPPPAPLGEGTKSRVCRTNTSSNWRTQTSHCSSSSDTASQSGCNWDKQETSQSHSLQMWSCEEHVWGKGLWWSLMLHRKNLNCDGLWERKLNEILFFCYF